MVSPDGNISTTRLLEMFIDDTYQLCNTSDHDTILEQTASNLKHHSEAIFTTGGLLALFKCIFYHVRFQFDRDGCHNIVSMIDDLQSLPVVTGIDNEPVILDQLDPNVPRRTSGCFICPTGNQKETLKQIMEYATHWAKSISTSTLNPDEVKLSYHTVLLPQTTYRLAASYLSPEQCETIMQVIYSPIINAYGFQRNIAKIIVHSPEQYAGMAIHHIYDLQGHEKIKFLLMHVRKFDYTGKLMLMCFQWTQLWSGLETSFINHDFNEYGHLVPHSWLKHLWQYTDSRAIQIDITKTTTFPLQRDNDAFVIPILHIDIELP